MKRFLLLFFGLLIVSASLAQTGPYVTGRGFKIPTNSTDSSWVSGVASNGTVAAFYVTASGRLRYFNPSTDTWGYLDNGASSSAYWPLTGTATLTGNTTINGSGTRSVTIGTVGSEVTTFSIEASSSFSSIVGGNETYVGTSGPGWSAYDGTLPLSASVTLLENGTLRHAAGFTFSSGSATYKALHFDGSINMTGGTNTVYGIDYRPAVSGTTGLTHIGLNIESGEVRFPAVTQDDTKTRLAAFDATTGKVFWRDASTLGGGGVSDGDKGDITVSSGGTAWAVDADISKTWTGDHVFNKDGNTYGLGVNITSATDEPSLYLNSAASGSFRNWKLGGDGSDTYRGLTVYRSTTAGGNATTRHTKFIDNGDVLISTDGATGGRHFYIDISKTSFSFGNVWGGDYAAQDYDWLGGNNVQNQGTGTGNILKGQAYGLSGLSKGNIISGETYAAIDDVSYSLLLEGSSTVNVQNIGGSILVGQNNIFNSGGVTDFGGINSLYNLQVGNHNEVSKTHHIFQWGTGLRNHYGLTTWGNWTYQPKFSFGTANVQYATAANKASFVIANGYLNNASHSDPSTYHSHSFTHFTNGWTQINTTNTGFVTGGTDLTEADVTPKAALEVVSTTSGVLVPRLTNTQFGAIPGGNLVDGLLLYESDNDKFKFRQNGAWVELGSGSGIGGSTGATDNALLRADGTGGATAQSSSVIITDDADVTLGTSSTAGATRTIQADGSSAAVSLTVVQKGAADVTLGNTSTSSAIINASSSASILVNNSLNNTTGNVLQLSKSTTGSPAVGHGGTISYNIETTAGLEAEMVQLNAVTTNVGSGTEAADFVVKTMSGGSAATEKFRVSSAGVVTNSIGGTTYTLVPVLENSATLDFASTLAQTDADLTITVTGAQVGDEVSLGIPNGSVVSGGTFTAWVSSTNTVTVRFSNYSASAKDPASGTFKVNVHKN